MIQAFICLITGVILFCLAGVELEENNIKNAMALMGTGIFGFLVGTVILNDITKGEAK